MLANQAKRQQERDCVVFSKLIAIYLFLGGTAAGAFALVLGLVGTALLALVRLEAPAKDAAQRSK